MRTAVLAFLIGIVAFLQLATLPDPRWAGLLILVVPALFVSKLRLPAAFLGGVLWTLFHGSVLLSSSLPQELEGRDLVLEGQVVSLPEEEARNTRFVFDVDRLRSNGFPVQGPDRVRLSWYNDPPPIHAGEHWRLKVRLKRPHGFMNAGGFDFEGWLFQQGIRATGYVRKGSENRLLDDGPGGQWLHRWRQWLREGLDAALDGQAHKGIVAALAIGDRQAITGEHWETLKATGTNHLVAISGLHVGLVAAALFLLVRRLWSWFGRAAERFPAPKAGALAALLGALLYAALAGFAVPTQRALIMIAAAMAAILVPRQPPPSHILALALFLVLLADPLAVMSAGFWLSFGAVAVLIYGMAGRLHARGLWWQWGRAQWLATVGLAPALWLFFQQASVASPLANIVAVPWVSFLVVPLTLLGTFLLPVSNALAAGLLWLAHELWSWLWLFLHWLGDMDAALWVRPEPPPWALAAAVVGVVWLLAPRGLPARWVGLVWLAPLALLRPPGPAEGEVWFTLLDVGQGLSAVVRTHSHVLVYDTGPRFSADFDTGEAVVVPFLRHQGVARVDTLVISHGDNDHVGGTKSVLHHLTTDRVLSSVPEQLDWAAAQPCRAGDRWQWDGVWFQILHPPADASARRENDASCVVRVDAAGGSILLPGDIEKGAERALLARGAPLAADILVAPHHGSRTSSTQAFIDAVDARYVLFPVGYRNRFGFPKPAVVERYRRSEAMLYDSANDGAIEFRLVADAPIGPPATRRSTAARFWHDVVTLPGQGGLLE